MPVWVKPVFIVLLLIGLGVLLQQLPLAAMMQRLADLAWWQWPLWLGLNLLLLHLATLRWWLFLTHFAPFSFYRLLVIRQAGQVVNMLTPGPQVGGEPLQLYWLARQHLSLSKCLVALGLDRLLELGINLSVLALGLVLLLDSRFNQLVSPVLPGASWLLMLPVAALLLWWCWQPGWLADRCAPLMAKWRAHPRLAAYMNTSDQSLLTILRSLLQTPTLWLAGIGLSLGVWVLVLSELALLLQMVNVQLTVDEFVLLALALRLAQFVPVPAGLGALEAAVFGACALLDLSAATAGSLILLMRCRDLALILGGFICLRWVERMPNGFAQST